MGPGSKPGASSIVSNEGKDKNPNDKGLKSSASDTNIVDLLEIGFDQPITMKTETTP
jgi:hypothetical protein